MSADDPIDSRLRSDAAAWRAGSSPVPDEDRLLGAAVSGELPSQANRLRPRQFLLPILAAAAVLVLVGLTTFATTTNNAGPHRGPAGDKHGVVLPDNLSTPTCPVSTSAHRTSGGSVHLSARRSLGPVAVVTALAVGTLSSCTSATPASNPTSTPASNPATTLSSSPTHAPSSTRRASTPARTGSSTATKSSGPRFVVGARCQTAQLNLTRESGGVGAGGTMYMSLKLTNTSKVSCVTTGYPGLSVVDSSGKTVQHPAERQTGTRTQPVKQVSIAPGQAGYVLWTSSDVVPGPGCPTAFHGSRLRVYPPANTVALYIPYTDGFCDLGVGPLTTAKDR